ncbi:hypothetical protein [Nonomuraea endophytica]|uniref:Uncharacterized protein n=1 Tax=Nonomuraea endophytica TaxID=714136 RepID=A0A7W8EHL3_9ACTN|nr:hypothetical protein [Nonomuraea endophytica]MBB5081085.1 hypothetical protein [Nonomuraea endophytica]
MNDCKTARMWQRGLNWAAIVLVGGFGLMWLGVVLYATDASTPWIRFAQAAFGLLLAGWSVQKATVMIRA